MKYNSIDIRLDELELLYLLDLVEFDQKVGGPLMSVEVQGLLAEALTKLRAGENMGTEDYVRELEEAVSHLQDSVRRSNSLDKGTGTS